MKASQKQSTFLQIKEISNLKNRARDPPLIERIRAVIHFSLGPCKSSLGARLQSLEFWGLVSYYWGLGLILGGGGYSISDITMAWKFLTDEFEKTCVKVGSKSASFCAM